MKIKAFRGLIYSNYDSEAALARELGWTRQKVNKISNGVKVPNLQEVDALSKALKTNPNDLVQIFLTSQSPNGQPA